MEQIHDKGENKTLTQTPNEGKGNTARPKDQAKITQLENSSIEYPFRNHLEELLEVLKEEASFI